MARGDHPKRTPFYGACLMILAFLSIWPAATVDELWLSICLYVFAVVAGLAGCLMTFRDYSF
ncbi:hypothetical protein FOY51_21490 [Antrihabitans cavernicola]|uniref:Uncharacterized protein n=1 Tax=Antrihabitans cavernicola TaxID=2495913 RepID=A0A5A7S9P1_9NOCA|nr:hypothetical protein FOY51_21490 [Spelaeibacter cavernicola]